MYYFSSSQGNDANSGTMITSPWKSLSKAASITLKPTDYILLKSNDTWNEQLLLKDIDATEDYPVTITTYHTDPARNFPRAIINKLNNNSQTNSTILCINCQGVIFEFLELCNSHWGIALIYESPPESKAVSNILIQNNYFHHMNGNGFPNTSKWWGSAITSGQNTNLGVVTLYNLKIVNNLCNASDTFFRPSGYTIYAIHIGSGEMYGNALTYNYFNIAQLGNIVHDFNIINNVFLHNSPVSDFDFGTTDIIIVNAHEKSNVINNEFGYRGEWNTSYDGCAIDFETNAFGTTVSNNYIHHSYGAGIMIFGHPPELSENLNITNNIFIQDGCYQIHPDHGSIAFIWPNTSGIIQNSIFVACQNNLSIPIFWDNNKPQNLETWKFINNTIYNTTEHIVDDPTISITKYENTANITVKCGENVANNCLITYTLDGSKPSINSNKYSKPFSIYNVTTSVFFKAFKDNMIESAAVGQIIAF